MSKDPLERRSYRKSPGRQYGYDYDPLRSQSESTASKPGALLAQRPDPRRTRQFLRQSIIASKRSTSEDSEPATYPERETEIENTPPSVSPAHPKTTRRIRHTSQNLAYDEQDREVPTKRSAARPKVTRRIGYTSQDPVYHDVPLPDDYDPNRIYEEDEELPPGLRVVKKRKTSRRKLLVGMGAVLVAGGGIAAVSKLASQEGSQTDHTAHAIQEAFNRGVTQGADSARRELVSTLDSLEGFTLQGAIDAAKLTRVAYDVFVSPVVQFGSQLTTDFLNAMLKALKTGRGWLAGIYQDNTTLAAIQHVLESWADQVSKLPKQLDAITQTDLDGAQGYLSALQRKVADEKSKLDNPSPTPTAKQTQ